MTWRAIWLRAQLTAITVSAAIWLVLFALEPGAVALGWILAAATVAAWSSSTVFRLRCGGRRVSSSDRLRVLQAVAPIRSLRGRRQPEVLVSTRPSIGLVVGERELVVSRKLLNGLRTHEISDLQFATLTAGGLGVAVVNGSRLVAAVELFCLPWSLLQRLGRWLRRVAQWPVRKSGLQRWIAWFVLLLAAIELYQRGLWVSLVMVVLIGVAAVTTGRFSRAWAVRLAQLAEAEVRHSGLRPERPQEPDPWAFLFENEAERRHNRALWP